MIGQSGLPMMNNLADSKENAPEKVQAKPGASEAGAFEKALMPDAIADSVQTPSGPEQTSPPASAQTGGRMVAPDQSGAAQFVEPQPMPPVDGAPATSRDLLNHVSQPVAETPNNSQTPEIGDQMLQTSAWEGEAKAKAPEVEAQASTFSDKAASDATLKVDAALLASSTNERLDSGGGPQAKPDSASQLPGPVEAAVFQANRAEIRPQQQILQASIVSVPGPGSDSVATTQSSPISKTETASLSAAAQTSEKKNQSQVELAQLRPAGSKSLSEFRPVAASADTASQPSSAATSPNSPSSAVGTGELKLTVHTPTPPVQALAPETSFLAAGSPAERSDVLVGATTTVAATAASRLDATAAAQSPVDAKQVVHQINQAIIRMDGARTEVMLDPVELGRVSLTFITKDEGVTVLINADRSETADLLRRHGEQLQRDLSDSGYEEVDLDFGQGDDLHQGPSGDDSFDETAAVGSTTVSHKANFITSGLDIRI